MNTNWKTFLLSQQATVDNENHVFSPKIGDSGERNIYPLSHLAVLTVAGKDAAKLLQGQITCNVNDISEAKSSLAAMCNPKGRVIATFLLVTKADAFLMVLPVELLETVKKRLQMYVLRSDVKLMDSSDEFCLLGLLEPGTPTPAFATETQEGLISINFPALARRKLLITDADNAIRYCSGQVGHHDFKMADSDDWRSLDISSGIPWLTTETSEEFIPQMLNLDKLGGISFNKGCYTGQEIVARTHYLGKSKREMLLAECQTLTPPQPNSSIVNLDNEEQEVVGKVLSALQKSRSCKMLVILQSTETTYDNLGLQDDKAAQITLLPFYA
ncbi:MAG: folate-binding protein [Methyloglobulus sp.]